MTPNTKDSIAETTIAILTREMADDVSSFIRSLSYRRFAPDMTMEKRVLLHEAVRKYMAHGDRIAARQIIADGIDAEGEAFEIATLVNESEFLEAAIETIRCRMAVIAPELCVEGILEIIGRTTLYHLVDEIARLDHSTPLDIAVGKEVTVCYIPGSSRVKDYRDIATTSWKERSDSLSIYPDRTLIDFLGIVGVSKGDWLAAVERNTSFSSAAKMKKHLRERAAVWAAVPEWETDGSLDISDDDLVGAIDACPYGFTPIIAFTMNADEIFAMDFTETLEVTGGIVGLHDFTNGTGDPLRFEGTLKFAPKVRDMHLADDEPLGLRAIHGFLSSSFASNVTRTASVARTMTSSCPKP